jgi:hypothetical protein
MSEQLDQLTTRADRYYCTLADEGTIEDLESLQHFMSELVTYLESIGGCVKGIQYLDGREKNKY